MNRIYLRLACILAVLLVPRFTQATTISIVSGRDNSIFKIASSINNSSGAGYDILTGNTGVAMPLQPRRGLIWFDVSSIPASATITSATVTMQLSNASVMGPAAVNVSLYRLTSNWGEGTSNSTGNRGRGTGTGMGVAPTTNDATWNYRFYNTIPWATPGGDFIATASATQSVAKQTDGYSDFYSWQSATLISEVQSWVDGTQPNDGWLINADTTAINTERRFASREAPALSADLAHPLTPVVPVLTVQYEVASPAPEPATWGMLVLGGAGMLIYRILWSRRERPTS